MVMFNPVNSHVDTRYVIGITTDTWSRQSGAIRTQTGIKEMAYLMEVFPVKKEEIVNGSDVGAPGKKKASPGHQHTHVYHSPSVARALSSGIRVPRTKTAPLRFSP